MITMEMVEKLRSYGNVSYEDAKRALEHSEGDLLDAVIFLENEGKIKAPSSEESEQKEKNEKKEKKQENAHYKQEEGVRFSDHIKNIFKWVCGIIHVGNINSFVVTRKGERVISIPVTILAVLLVFLFWIIFPLIILGLFFSYQYAFRGPNFTNEHINNVMGSMTDAAENFKNTVKDAANEETGRNNSDN